jgi:excinuclease ABC subunit A
VECPECHGQRLKKESLCFLIGGKNIAELTDMDLTTLAGWFDNMEGELDERKKLIGHEIIRRYITGWGSFWM